MASTGVPPFYPLEFYNNTLLGVPFYHFRNDWLKAGPVINFRDENGQAATVGDKVKTWKNAYLPTGQGDAEVPPVNMNGGNYWEKNYPTVTERTYGVGTNAYTYTGLQFNGTEYMQIEGRTVADAYGLTEALFSTGGTSLMDGHYKDSGASFLFVLHSDQFDLHTLTGPPYDPSEDPADGHQILLYSRQRNTNIPPVTTGPYPTFPPGYTWPTDTEDHGLQCWFSGGNHRWRNPAVWWSTFPKLGPQGVYVNPNNEHEDGGAGNDPLGREMQRPEPDPNCGTCPPYSDNDGLPNGSTMGIGWRSGSPQTYLAGYVNIPHTPGCPPIGTHIYPPGPTQSPYISPMMQPGFQVLLYEIDNMEHVTYDGIQTLVPGWDPYTGPLIRFYTFGNNRYIYQLTDPVGTQAYPPWKGGNSLLQPRTCGLAPATVNKTLFHEHLLFMAGAPPWLGSGFAPYGQKYAHGFRGTIYEVMMFEGKLSDADKRTLEEVFKKKYQGAYKPPPK